MTEVMWNGGGLRRQENADVGRSKETLKKLTSCWTEVSALFSPFACNLCPIFHVPQFLRLSSILSLYALDNKPSEI